MILKVAGFSDKIMLAIKSWSTIPDSIGTDQAPKRPCLDRRRL
jgi:hypothetical protein